MDTEIAFWIIEYLLRHPEIDVDLVKRFLCMLPRVDDCQYLLKKALLLRQIQSLTSSGSVSEEILDVLEIINELDKLNGVSTVSQTMKDAYCAVAVECTLHVLGGSVENRGREYFDSAVRIWRRRISDELHTTGDEGLISERLLEWKDQIETSVWDPSVCADILKKKTINDALRLLNVYMAEEWEEIGPSFIDLAADYVIKMGKTEPESLRLEENDKVSDDAVPEIDVTRHEISSRSYEHQSNKGNCENKSRLQHNIMAAANRLMERNSTARVYEWDDLVEAADEEKSTRNEKHVCSTSGRRKPKKWSSFEEQTLRDAVKIYGRGNWKCILLSYPGVFVHRNEVDLKDKWRNMCRPIKNEPREGSSPTLNDLLPSPHS